MSTTLHSSVDQQSPFPLASSATSLLQRSCDCGSHTGGSGKCAKCRSEKKGPLSISGQISTSTNSPTHSPGAIAYDLSQVPAESSSRMAGPAGTARPNAQQGNNAFSGQAGETETGTLPQRESRDLLQCIQIMGEENAGLCREQVLGTPAQAAPTYPHVTHRVTLGPNNGGCGGFDFGSIFSVANATATTNGFVVQKVNFNLQRQTCTGATSNFVKTYWEAWEVRNGVVLIGTSTSRHDSDGIGDRFTVPPSPGHHGLNFLEGFVKFIPNYTAPHSWGHVPQALSLPSTESPPAGWSDSGTIQRWLRNDFDCCNGHTRSDMTSQR
jgi:hypothetical protein